MLLYNTMLFFYFLTLKLYAVAVLCEKVVSMLLYYGESKN